MKNSVAHINHCYGCGVCAISCAHDSIEIKLDKLGFYRPIVNTKTCTDCGVCRKTCSYLDEELAIEDTKPIDWFASFSKDDNTISTCSSGGFAYELAKVALEEKYKIIGVRYNVEKHRAEHVVCTNLGELEETKGSKYLPSYTVDAFVKIKKGEKWMIIGTPCQMDSLRRYIKLRHMENDVVLVDFFCHGVPSYHMWHKNEMINFSGIKIKSIAFRSKKNYIRNQVHPWHDSYIVTCQDEQNVYHQPSLEGHTNWFYHYFLNNLCLGKHCYKNCKYKMYRSVADIRIGDAWSSAYIDNEKGVSAVLVFTNKGAELVSKIKNLHRNEIEIDKLCEGQMSKMPKQPKWYKLRLRLMQVPKLRFGHIEKFIEILNKWTRVKR